MSASAKLAALDTKLKALTNGFDIGRADALLDELFRLLPDYGKLQCFVVNTQTLRVQSPTEILGDAPIRLAAGKLSTLCARLGERCRQWSGQELSLHGDTVEFDHPTTRRRFRVEFENTQANQRIEFADVAVLQTSTHRKADSGAMGQDVTASHPHHRS